MAASAEEVVLRGRLTDELERALMAIPERQRMAIVLAEVQGLNGPELAEAIGTSHDAARALLARARESLRQALAVERARAGVGEAAGRDEATAGHTGTGGRRWRKGPGA
jgi:RNA polymerase sigma-70 factor (ECF subfamily)